jgi:hypothetical protein
VKGLPVREAMHQISLIAVLVEAAGIGPAAKAKNLSEAEHAKTYR